MKIDLTEARVQAVCKHGVQSAKQTSSLYPAYKRPPATEQKEIT
ncbi:hypothetical protein KGM_207458 [Danaus plexippus plexippus]|uniref:Uncharacterized protein n=1 Tax=Danaus plexippus plexippus TaxID=278856 RepID=A0A212F4F5_DANPL|nr:hypothetical protein KGM_207458 [Danaus plexippus plexippus]